MTQGAGPGLGTQTDLMQRAAQQIATVQSDITAQISGLRQRLADMPGLWQGPAGAAFVRLMNQCNDDGVALAAALANIGEQVKTSGVIYQTNEDDQMSKLQAVNPGVAGGGSISAALKA